MKWIAALTIAVIVFAGCKTSNEVDRTAPAVPQGVRALSLDNAVQLDWYPSQDLDLDGYRVWMSRSLTGRYTQVATVHTNQFVDHGVVNGNTYYYAVSSFDLAGNESELSTEAVSATPRPEGLGVQIDDVVLFPNLSGYDFSTETVGPYNDGYTDVYFQHSSAANTNMLLVPLDTDIQDMGYTGTLDDITIAPTAGWSPTGSAEAIIGHTYVVWTHDDHYAKMRLTEVSSTQVRFDWAYQPAASNTQLKVNRPPREGRDGSPAATAVR